MKESKISVIVPVYDVEKYLYRCVDSILEQTHSNTEIILVNDESPDNCGEICEEYARKDSRIKVIHRKNGGLSAARNSGLEQASGDYISFVDSDDWIHPKMLEVMLKTLVEYNTEVVECDLITSLDTPVNYPENDDVEIIVEEGSDILNRIIKNQHFSVWRRLYKHELIKGLTFLEGKNSEDVYYTFDVFKKTNKNVRIRYHFYTYFVNLEGITKMPYTLKKLDSLDAALYLQDNAHTVINNTNLVKVINQNLLDTLLYHYKLLNYNPQLDRSFQLRKKIKTLIGNHYNKDDSNNLYLKLSRYLPLSFFNIIIRLNKIRRNKQVR